MRIVQLQPTDADLERFWALRLEALQTAPTAFGSSYEEESALSPAERRERQRGRMSATNVVFMAEENGVYTGMTGLVRSTRLKTRHTAFIWGVYVQPMQRGRGIARRLMERAIAQARDFGGVAVVTLTVTATNAAAIHLYESLGFVTWGTEPAALYVDEVYYDMHHMALRLKSG